MVLPIIASWRSLLDLATIDQFAQACVDVKTMVSIQIKARKAIQHYVSSITTPPLRSDLGEALQKDCDRARKLLARELCAFQEALNILQKFRAPILNRHNLRRRKAVGRDPATPGTVRGLHTVLSPHIPSRRARAQLIYDLLKACDPEAAPSVESIRSGYR